MAVYEIDEISDVMVDAAVTDGSGNFLFGSIWGRDTAIQEILGRLTLPSSDYQALTRMTLLGNGVYRTLFFNKDQLEKRVSTHPGTLFGTISHLFLWDKRLVEPDYANAFGYWICRGKWEVERFDRTWNLVRDLLPYPLLNDWMFPVMDAVDHVSNVEEMWSIGSDLVCARVEANLNALTNEISKAIRSGLLTA